MNEIPAPPAENMILLVTALIVIKWDETDKQQLFIPELNIRPTVQATYGGLSGQVTTYDMQSLNGQDCKTYNTRFMRDHIILNDDNKEIAQNAYCRFVPYNLMKNFWLGEWYPADAIDHIWDYLTPRTFVRDGVACVYDKTNDIFYVIKHKEIEGGGYENEYIFSGTPEEFEERRAAELEYMGAQMQSTNAVEAAYKSAVISAASSEVESKFFDDCVLFHSPTWQSNWAQNIAIKAASDTPFFMLDD